MDRSSCCSSDARASDAGRPNQQAMGSAGYTGYINRRGSPLVVVCATVAPPLC